MRIHHLSPLLIFLGLAIGLAVFIVPRDMINILGFTGFIFGFGFTFISGISETVKHGEAVIKIEEKKPFLIPISCFLISNILITFINIKYPNFFIQYSSFIIACIGTYFWGIGIVLKDLRQNHKCRVLPASGRPKSKKLLLINPVNPHQSGLTVNQSSVFPPLGLGILAALTPDDYEIRIIDENIKPFIFERADLVGITAFTASANRAYEIAALYRVENIPVVMGGIHASMLPDEALKFVNTVVIGEAETIWKQVIDDFNHDQLKRTYRGEFAELKNLPIPRRDLFSDEYLFATVQTSRGCPMDCYFCSVTPFNGKKYRQRPFEEVLDELEKIPQKMIFFVDDNILGYGKAAEERAIQLFKGMVERKLNKSWFCQASLNFGENEEVLKWAAKSGCKMVFIGLESADPEELHGMHKSLNLKLDYEKTFQKIHKYGIVVLGAFIFGSDTETKESIIRKTDYILKSSIDVIQATKLTPLPGTRLFEEYQRAGRLVANDFPADWDHYDMGELTYQMKRIPESDFYLETEWAFDRIYAKFTLIKRFWKTFRLTRSLEAAFWAYQSNLNYRNVGLARNFSIIKRKQ